MNKIPSQWIALSSLAVFALVGSAYGELLDASAASTPSVSSVKDKVCVVSHNTGLAMWYNTANHGFTPTVAPDAASGFAAAEDLVFGNDHQLASSNFDSASIYSIDRGNSDFSRFVSEASKGLGAPVGYVFGKDRQLYLTSRSPASELELIDAEGNLLDATLNYGIAERQKLQQLMKSDMSAVPEPSSLALVGVAGLAFAAWRRRRS
ncbi:MAG: PEP-CTERM sorting domain-containing protein [Verrucomicrobiota bacterium]